jgi:hypothetical protein
MSTPIDLEKEVKQQAKHLSSLSRVVGRYLVNIEAGLVELGDKIDSNVSGLHKEILELRMDLEIFKDEIRKDLKGILDKISG